MEAPPTLARIAAVVPCHNRPADAGTLLADLAALDRAGIDLRIILVDNCSAPPLSDLPTPPTLRLDHLRLNTNTGGSGGFNAGLSLALSSDDRSLDPDWQSFDPEFIWLVDSDARIPPGTLRILLDTLRADDHIIAAGPAIADPATNQPFELGGRINRRTGVFEPLVPGAAGVTDVRCEMSDVRCKTEDGLSLPTSHISHLTSHIDYLAACCALVRASAARAAGAFPDTFLNGDDVEWFVRMAQRTGGRIVATPHAVALHPRYDRFPTWTRYYTTRNANGPLHAIGASRLTHFRRAMRDALRATQQEMAGRPDLARLHLKGLAHAATGQTRGPAPAGTIDLDPPIPLDQVPAALESRLGSLKNRFIRVHPHLNIPKSELESLLQALIARGAKHSALCTLHSAPRPDIALVPARARPDSWFAAPTLIHLAPNAAWIRSPSRLLAPLRAARALALGTLSAARIARRRAPGPSPLNPAARAALSTRAQSLSVEAIILSHNRWPALEQTVTALLSSPAFLPLPEGGGRGKGSLVPDRTITIIDNASRDGTPDRVETFLLPRGVNLIKLDTNAGVNAFNIAVARSTADAVLILDDDATPDENSLLAAIDELASRPELGAVTLHPIHPKTGKSEWPVPPRTVALDGPRCSPPCSPATSTDSWPLMGCANLIRRSSWNLVRGYEPTFFLYRNDADLALKLLAAGQGVHFNPALIVWHDSPSGPGQPKSPRWHELATRNWIWMAKRHSGMGIPGGTALQSRAHFALGALLGYLWSHKLAGLSIDRHLATLRGGFSGLTQPAPPIAPATPNGAAWRSLLRLHLRRRSPSSS